MLNERMENLDPARIHAGLPERATVPDHVITAFEEGRISEKDLVPNIAAHISATHRPNVEPPLNAQEVVARWKHIRALAALSQGWQ